MADSKKNVFDKFKDWLAWWPWAHNIYTKHEEFFVYIVVGCTTTIVSWASKFLANIWLYGGASEHDTLQTTILTIVCWTTGVIYAYFTNRAYVFKSKAPMLPEAGKFVLSRISTFFLDYFVMLVLDTWLHINFYLATFISAVLVFLTNYFLGKLLVFSKKGKENKHEAV